MVYVEETYTMLQMPIYKGIEDCYGIWLHVFEFSLHPMSLQAEFNEFARIIDLWSIMPALDKINASITFVLV